MSYCLGSCCLHRSWITVPAQLTLGYICNQCGHCQIAFVGVKLILRLGTCIVIIATGSLSRIWCWASFLLCCESNTIQTHRYNTRADSRSAPRQWETSLQRNAVSHWLGVNLVSSLQYIPRNMLMVYDKLYFVRVWYRSILPISTRVTSVLPRQRYFDLNYE